MKTVSGTCIVRNYRSTSRRYSPPKLWGRGDGWEWWPDTITSTPHKRKQTTMHTKNSPEYKRTLRRWAELTRLQDERGLTVQEGRELRTLHEQLHAAEASSIAALTDDYAETMLREAGHIGGCEW